MSEKTEFLEMEFEVKSAEIKENPSGENVGVVVAYAAAFENIDHGGDIIKKGAFKKTIRDKKGKWPMLMDHSPYNPLGFNIKAEEDDHGLLVEEEFNLDVKDGLERYSLTRQALRLKIKIGRSIGYRAIKVEFDEVDGQRVRILKEVKIFEHSPVTFPMNEEAFAVQAKNWKLKFEGKSAESILDYWISQVGEEKAVNLLQTQLKTLQETEAVESKDNIFEKPESIIHSLEEVNKLFKY